MMRSSSRRATARASFRQFLQAELARRCAKNPRYSLRAFAARLGVDHGTLSQVLRRRRALTAATIRKIGTRLRLEESAIAEFIEHERRFGTGSSSAAPDVKQLTHDTAVLVSEWHHFAILELIRLREFRADSRWIARVLGLTADEVNVALQRLLRLGMLEMRGRGKWIDTTGDAAADVEEFTHAAVRHLFERVPPRLREHSATTLAISSERLPEALDRIARFHRDLAALLARGDARDDVYRLEISLFPVTTMRHPKET
ncbi:MAG: DUF4423 domain-containing protein [Acidobacteria bacterium]|nr:DUF4423 domain-containing protein [Acidobacteriota bacterium]